MRNILKVVSLLGLYVFSLPVHAQELKPPLLTLELAPGEEKIFKQQGKFVALPNQDYIFTDVTLKIANPTPDSYIIREYQYLSVTALNAPKPLHPTLILDVEKIVGKNFAHTPTKIDTNGGGGDINSCYTSIDLQIPYPPSVERQRATKLASQMYADVRKRPGYNFLFNTKRSITIQSIASALADQVDNQPGDYRIIAIYTAQAKGQWNGTVKSQPLWIRIVDQSKLPRM